MKRIIFVFFMTVVACLCADAQSLSEMAKKKREDNKVLLQLMKDNKPNSNAKKRAKQLVKQGFMPIGSGEPIENQVMKDMRLKETLMEASDGSIVERYIQVSATAVSGNQGAASRTARVLCQEQISAAIKTKLAAAMKESLATSQISATEAAMKNLFNEKLEAILDATLSNATIGLNIYRVLPNNNVESMITVSFDKKELVLQLKEKLIREMEAQGKELDGIVDGVINGWKE